MNRFAQLLDRLAYEPGRNNKLRLIEAYFRDVGDPDRGYALAALAGALSFKHANPGLVRDLIGERTDPVLFGLSYDYVGDLTETVALMWPKGAANSNSGARGHPPPQPSPARGEGAPPNPERPSNHQSGSSAIASSSSKTSPSSNSALSIPSPLAGEGQGGGYRT